ncbi:MAG: hypothetical protein Q3959_06595 [Limosilactobacillus sp.]|uniref:ABC transporter permease n=1 Tax=Limosilactobacillus sp. TaxID=2773925 RepID=UPI002703AE45|nr:hypothetical protein [Limosilactobacillus sp.]
MKNLFYQFGLNVKRVLLRNPSFFLFDLGFPIMFYVIFTKAINQGVDDNFKVVYLINMIVYGIISTAIMSVPITMENDLKNNFVMSIELSPLSKLRYYVQMIVMFTILNFICVIGIGVAGVLVNNIKIPLTEWIKIVIALPVISTPFVLIGIALSLTNNYNLTSSLSKIVYFAFAIFGGLWFPMQMLPKWMREVGEHTPVYSVAKIGMEIVKKQDLSMDHLINLFIWLFYASLAIYVILRVSKRKELRV